MEFPRLCIICITIILRCNIAGPQLEIERIIGTKEKEKMELIKKCGKKKVEIIEKYGKERRNIIKKYEIRN